MIRMNITVPEEIAHELKNIKNKSRFIADALRIRFQMQKKKRLEALMIEGYKASAHQDKQMNAEWEEAELRDGWDE